MGIDKLTLKLMTKPRQTIVNLPLPFLTLLSKLVSTFTLNWEVLENRQRAQPATG